MVSGINGKKTIAVSFDTKANHNISAEHRIGHIFFTQSILMQNKQNNAKEKTQHFISVLDAVYNFCMQGSTTNKSIARKRKYHMILTRIDS